MKTNILDNMNRKSKTKEQLKSKPLDKTNMQLKKY